MDEIILGLLFLLGFLALILVLPIRAALRATAALRKSEELEHKIRSLEAEVKSLRGEAKPQPQVEQVSAKVESQNVEEVEIEAPVAPPPLVHSVPPPLPPALPNEPEVRRPSIPAPRPVFNIEQFMGAKLFAWIGGLALFLGVVFFVKYAFERNLIHPAVRVAIGFITGAGLVVAGVLTHRKKAYAVLGQTFCASGALISYGVTFAAHELYQFPTFGPVTTFLVMCAITTIAFVLAVRMNAPVIAILGMAGGFLTPLLVSTGQDHVLGLFSYIALLDIGLLAVARFRGWAYLSVLAAVGTLVMEAGWYLRFFEKGHYFEGAITWIPVAIFVVFVGLFAVAGWRVKRMQVGDGMHQFGSAIALGSGALLFAFSFLDYPSITSRPGILYGFVFAINVLMLAIVVVQPKLAWVQGAAAIGTFVHLAVWTQTRLKPDELPAALICYLVFGLLHSVFPLVWRRFRGAEAALAPATGWIPIASLVLILLPILELGEVSFWIWPAILLVDALLIGLAVQTQRLGPVLAAICLTLLAAALWLFKMPTDVKSLTPFLGVVGMFAVALAVAGVWLGKSFWQSGRPDQRVLAILLPVSSAALPFLLLVMAIVRLPMPSPTPVFGLGLTLAVILLVLMPRVRQPVLSLGALGCVLALELTWHTHHFALSNSTVPLLWYVVFGAVFFIHPFLFRRQVAGSNLPWAASALAVVGHYFIIQDWVRQTCGQVNGWLPAAFALPPLLGLVWIHRSEAEPSARQTKLAWFGGVSLFFITLIFPVQFDRQWITLGWALEGAALCWLFTRVGHPGLRYVGFGLLTAAFVRLALNPAVLSYQDRSGSPILNWHLYAYSIAAVSQFIGAWWLRPPHHRIQEMNARAVLYAFGGVLLFLLLNIEIADFFTPPGERFITIDFSVHFARDMTYSIAWGLFALGLIVIGLWKNQPGARYAGVGLLVVTLLKLFAHDLASIESVFRIAALIGVALIALAASFLYQRFFDRQRKE